MSRNFSDSQRNTIWSNYFGNATSGTDAYERDVLKSNFEADHIYPFAEGGKTVVENGMPLHPDSNTEKDDYMSGVVNDYNFQVQGKPEKGVVNVGGTAYDYEGER